MVLWLFPALSLAAKLLQRLAAPTVKVGRLFDLNDMVTES